MARTKKTDDVIESVEPVTEDTVQTIEAVDIVTEMVEPVKDKATAVKDLLDELTVETEKLGNIAHLFYVEQGRQRILALVSTLKTYL